MANNSVASSPVKPSLVHKLSNSSTFKLAKSSCFNFKKSVANCTIVPCERFPASSKARNCAAALAISSPLKAFCISTALASKYF